MYILVLMLSAVFLVKTISYAMFELNENKNKFRRNYDYCYFNMLFPIC